MSYSRQTNRAIADFPLGVDECILCGGKKFVKIVEGRDRICPVEGTFTVYKCESCGLHRTEPRLSPEQLRLHYGPEYPIYDPSVVSRLARRGKRLRRSRGVKRWALDLLARTSYEALVTPSGRTKLTQLLLIPLRWKARRVLPFRDLPGRVLDIGCGPGAFLITAYSRGWTCYGVDTSCEIISHLAESGIAETQCSSFEEAEYAPGSFDLVNMSHILEHVQNPIATLRKVASLLQPEGLIIMRIPCVSLEARLFGTYWPGWDLPRHLFHFNRDTLRMALSVAGLDVLALRGEVSSNNAIWGIRHFMLAHQRTRRIGRSANIRSRAWQFLLWPFAFVAYLVGQSGRIYIVARKKQEA